MKIIILGSGIIGITSAWFLKKQGHKVTVIDKQNGPAQETSFANGGQISISNSQPLINAYNIKKIITNIKKKNTSILYNIKPCKWLKLKWTISCLKECLIKKTNHNIKKLSILSKYSIKLLQSLINETNIKFNNLKNGVLRFYTNESSFKSSISIIKIIKKIGCDIKILTPDEIIKLEPSLSNIKNKIIGGDFTPSDESGNTYKLATSLMQESKKIGVKYKFNTKINKLIINENKIKNEIKEIEITDEDHYQKRIKADAFLVTLGINSEPLLRPLGIKLLLYPAKGYSVTYKINNNSEIPITSLIDEEKKLVISRLKNKLRIAGICEINDYKKYLNYHQCNLIKERTKQLFPKLCNYENPLYWIGLRALTPSGLPYIGKTKFKNLFINTGHGHLGLTTSLGSGKLISDIISNKKTKIIF